MKALPNKTTPRKIASTAKTSSKKKSTSQKAAPGKTAARETAANNKAAPKKPLNSEIKRNEVIAGITLCIAGIFSLVNMFRTSITGTIGPAVKNLTLGVFGSFGYILPMIVIVLGLILIIKKQVGINWKEVIIWSIFFLCTALFFHTFFLREIFAKKVVEVDFSETAFKDYLSAAYNYGITQQGSSGALGGILSYWLLKNLGIFGAVFIPLTYIIIVLAVKNRSALAKFISDTKARIDARIEEKQNELTPIERLGTQPPAASARRMEPVYTQPQSKSQPQTEQSLHVLKNKKQSLYIEDIGQAQNEHTGKTELNTDFLTRNNNQPLASNKTYAIDEDSWNQALEKEHSIQPTSATAKHSHDAKQPTIQINITDKDDYTSADTKLQPKHSAAADTKFEFPPLDLIAFSNNKLDDTLRAECHSNAMRLEETLASFRIDAKVINITCGPTVTRYELRPAPGIRVSKINGLSKDLAMSLAATSVRIEAPIPNKNAVGIEVPNRTRSIVGLRDILEGSKFKMANSHLTICVGKDITGRNIVADLAKMPHMLVAGATGSGKSVFINSLILSLIYKSSPDDVRFIMIDPKKVELNVYNGIPHLLIPVVTKASLAASALNWAVKEMMKRYDIFAENGARNLDGYNKLTEVSPALKPMPRIVIIVDELADLMQVASAEVEDAIYRLAQLARAAGMHLVIATQRPDVKVITGTIKANIPCRVAFAVNQLVDSRTILDSSGAEHLLGNGDMLFKFGGKPMRLQGAFVADKEVEKVCNFLKAEGVTYDNAVMEDVKKIEKQNSGDAYEDGSTGSEFDNLLPDAVKVIYDNEKASTSMVQRKLRVGYNRAARIIDDLERLGVLGPPDGSKPRDILVTYGTAIQIVSGENDE
jgi:S-DNA-T family DNA segregation ATPase FtsK/SpoIIIE